LFSFYFSEFCENICRIYLNCSFLQEAGRTGRFGTSLLGRRLLMPGCGPRGLTIDQLDQCLFSLYSGITICVGHFRIYWLNVVYFILVLTRAPSRNPRSRPRGHSATSTRAPWGRLP
jgi:hypothetical protein